MTGRTPHHPVTDIGGGTGGRSTPSNPKLLLAFKLSLLSSEHSKFEISDNIDPNDALHFTSLDECLSALPNLSFKFQEQNVTELPDGKLNHGIRIGYVPFGGLEILVKMSRSNSSGITVYNVDELKSYEYGQTFSWSWRQTDSEINNNSNPLIVELEGKVRYNLFIEGIGTVFVQTIRYIISFDKTTGKQVKIERIK